MRATLTFQHITIRLLHRSNVLLLPVVMEMGNVNAMRPRMGHHAREVVLITDIMDGQEVDVTTVMMAENRRFRQNTIRLVDRHVRPNHRLLMTPVRDVEGIMVVAIAMDNTTRRIRHPLDGLNNNPAVSISTHRIHVPLRIIIWTWMR